MFGTLGRSWEFAKTSYSIIWRHKSLLIFPLISGVAAMLVIASFVLPLWTTGTLETWADSADSEGGNPHAVAMYMTLFAFYFCNYFVIIFFNSAMIACVMQVLEGQQPNLGYGMSMAARRLPQIIGWAFISAVIGVVLRIIENSNKRAGQIVAAILGSAWTALTYFVVPTIVMEGAGPAKSFKGSLGILKRTWGTALVSNFSIGLISFLISLPVWLGVALLVYVASQSGSMAMWVLAITVGSVAIILVSLASSAADTVLKALLYSWATGRSIPDGVAPAEQFEWAFTTKKERG